MVLRGSSRRRQRAGTVSYINQGVKTTIPTEKGVIMKAAIFCCLILLFVAVDQGRSEAQTVERYGLTSGQHQRAFDELVSQGYRLIRVIGHGGYEPTYDGVWVKRGGPAWEARHGMTSANYQRTFDDLVGNGYRLIWVSGYGVGNRALYAAIWEKRGGSAWEARHGMSQSQYQRISSDLVGNGYRETCLSRYYVGGQIRYAGIWEK
jgi:hypothetical protein